MYRFDLEKAIGTWRHALYQRRAFNADDLDELEQHLRDHVEAQLADGSTPEGAYRAALARLGTPGDLIPEYQKVQFGRSKRKASLQTFIVTEIQMFSNYLKIALRTLKRHKGFTFINLGGLAVGLAACLLIGLYVQDELAFDDHFADSERIYRLGSGTGWPYGRILREEFPEVESLTYLRGWPSYAIKHNQEYLFETMYYADEAFFDIFSYDFRAGNPETALQVPYSVVLSEELAERLYGEAEVLGQEIILGDTLLFTVTGVVDVPRRSHLQFDFLVSMATMRARSPEGFDQQMANGWLNLNMVNYLRLKEGVEADAFREKIRDLPMQRAGDFLTNFGSNYTLKLEPLEHVYLSGGSDGGSINYSAGGNMLGPQSDISYVYLLSAVGLFLLLIAAINFVNLSTARSVDRAKEVGVRKAVGSNRGALVRQFLLESMLMSVVAVALAVVLAVVALPYFNDLAARAYTRADFFSVPVLLILLALTVGIGVLAGLYPALALSRFKPVEVLKGRFAAGKRGGRLRQGLVVFQYVVSGVLIVATLVVISQLRFMQGKELGFAAEQVLVLDARQAPGADRWQRGETLRQVLVDHSGVQHASAMWAVPGRTGWRGQLSFPEGWPQGQSIGLEYIGTDHHFAEALGLNFVAGRSFDPAFATDASEAVIINEAAVEAVGWDSPAAAIGKQFTSPGSGKPNGVVIGVVEDFHQHGLQETIQPIMYGVRAGTGLYALRIDPTQASAVLAHIEQRWGDFFGTYPYSTFFLDQDFARQYAEEQRLLRIFATFAGLTVLIACLGLFGLAAFTVSQRTKEIGVRKVLGATGPQIVLLLSKDFLKLILVAAVVAVPVAYVAMSRWLETFAYRTDLGAAVFLVSSLLLLLIAFTTVSWQALKAARMIPAKSLRYE